MILEKQKEIEILVDGDESQASIGMSLDLDSAQMLMQMLSKNLYSDGIGSTIRETASNALDSHRKAGVTDIPIIVSLKRNKEDNYEFSVEDFGEGLDNDDVENIISKYGKSTKRLEANALGMFGLGFKSPLAYSSSFFFICRKNGIERKYMMYEGEDINTIDLLSETNTKEKNGVKVIVPVKWGDRYDFYYKIKEQLAYFESVYFDVSVDNFKHIDNNFIIHRGKSFQFSEITTDKALHICLDNVYYPLDFAKLGINIINIPIGLRFNLSDGLYPTPNRESIRYTPEAKTIIVKKIEELANYYLEKFNSTIIDSKDPIAVFDYYNNKHITINSGINDNIFVITDLVQFASIKKATPNIIGVKKLNIVKLAQNSSILLAEYANKFRIINNRITEIKNSWNRTIYFTNLNNKTHLFSEKLTGIKKMYLKETYNSSETHTLMKKEKSYSLFPRFKKGTNDNYYEILNLRNFPKEEWRELIKEFQYIQQLIFDKIDNIDNIVIPEKWLNDKKKISITTNSGTSFKRVKLQGEVSCKIGTNLLRYVDGKNSKLEPATLKLAEIHKQPNLYVYGLQEDVPILDLLFDVVSGKQKLKTLVFSEREHKVVEKVDIHNLMSIKKFMEGKNKIFKRLITAYLIHKLIEKHSYTFHHRNYLKGISTSLLEDLDTLCTYRDNNYVNSQEVLYKAMLDVAEMNNLFDGEMYPLYQRIKNLLERLPFLNPVLKAMIPKTYYKDSLPEMNGVLCDLFKYYRYRLDYQNYHLRLDDEPIEGEILEEENIEQLIN